MCTKLEEGFCNWWGEDGNVEWLNENSELWQAVQKHMISKTIGISEPEVQEIDRCGIRFNQQHLQKLSDAIEQNTVSKIVTNSSVPILQKLKTYQVLSVMGHKNSLFIGINSLKNKQMEISNFWPCKWNDVLVVDSGSDGNVAHRVLDILQSSADCEQGADNSDKNTVETLRDCLQKYEQILILISSRKNGFSFSREITKCFVFRRQLLHYGFG